MAVVIRVVLAQDRNRFGMSTYFNRAFGVRIHSGFPLLELLVGERLRDPAICASGVKW